MWTHSTKIHCPLLNITSLLDRIICSNLSTDKESNKTLCVVSLINSFQELGLLHRIAFNRDLADYCRSEFNDNFLFLIQPIANNNGEGHFFCEKGVLKTTLRFWKGLQFVYYHYSELSNLEKNRAGALRDKPTGYEIKGFNSEDWQSPIIDFINSKRNELSPANKT